MPKVFSKIGRTEESVQTERFISFVQSAGEKGLPYAEAYRHVHLHFPQMKDFEGIVAGAKRAGYIDTITDKTYGMLVKALKIPDKPEPT